MEPMPGEWRNFTTGHSLADLQSKHEQIKSEFGKTKIRAKQGI